MCALFSPRLKAKLREGPLTLGGEPVRQAELLAAPALQRAEPLTADVAPYSEAFMPPELVSADLASQPATVVPGPPLAVGPKVLPTHGLTGAPFLLVARVLEPPGERPVRLVSDLAYMRKQPLLRRGVAAHMLSEEQQSYWVKRLADAKRLAPRHIKLSAIFSDVPLEGDRPVSYRPEEEAIAYLLPTRPVVPSTIVVARNAITGEPLQARFYKEPG